MGWSHTGPMDFGHSPISETKQVSSLADESRRYSTDSLFNSRAQEPLSLLKIQGDSQGQKLNSSPQAGNSSQKILLAENTDHVRSSPFAKAPEKKIELPSWMVQSKERELANKERPTFPKFETNQQAREQPKPQAAKEPLNPFPFQQVNAGKSDRLRETNRFSIPEEQVPLYRDAKLRAGNVTLTKLDSQEAAKIIGSIPELFRKEGMRELSALTADDAKKSQVYVSQDAAAFQKQNPGKIVFSSIQEAVNRAPKDSVINVVAGTNGKPYSESVSVGRSDLTISTNQQNPAVIEGGGFNIGSNIHNVRILNFDFRNFTGREAAIRVEGKNIANIVVGGNYFYSAVGSEAAGFYGTGSAEQEAMKNVYLVANVVGQDRQGNSKPLNITAKQLEATPFNGNVSDVVAIGNLYFGTKDTPLNLGMDFIGGEKVSGNSELNRARNAFVAFNYSKHIGHPQRWASGVAYVDGASRITEVLNMAESSNFCGEIGAERPGAHARDNTFSGNLCKDIQNYWITVGAPDNNGARVSGTKIQNNIVINANNSDAEARAPQLQYNPGITKQEIISQNQFFNKPTDVTTLPQKIVDLYRFHYGVKK